MKTILFVCTGNVCRSPMAEGLLRQAIQGESDYRVYSAGIGAVDGQPPTPHSVNAMRELGIDISTQRSRALTPELVRQADYIFGMTHSHVDTICLLYPHAAEKAFLLREFDETLDAFEKDIKGHQRPHRRLVRRLRQLPRPDRAGHRQHHEIHLTGRHALHRRSARRKDLPRGARRRPRGF
jgi:protein-tyrosine-phosphatase